MDRDVNMTLLRQPAENRQPLQYPSHPGKIWPQYAATIAASLTFILILVASWPAMSVRYQEENRAFENHKFFPLLQDVGAVAGAPLIGIVAYFCGRKGAVLFMQLLVILALIVLQATNINVLYLIPFYFIYGMALGGAFTIMPIYLSEIADDSHRGVLVVVMFFLATMASQIAPLIKIYWVLVVLCFLLSFLGIGAAIWMPESPSYLMSKGYQHKATKSLQFLRGEPSQTWQMATQQESSERNSILKPFLISLGLLALQSLQSIEWVSACTILSLHRLIETLEWPVIIMIVYQGACYVGSIAAIYFIKWRILLILSCIGSTLGGVIICLSFMKFDVLVITLLAGLFCIGSFLAAMAHLPFIVMAQLLPRNGNTLASSLIITLYFLIKFSQKAIFSYVAEGQYSLISFTVASAICTAYIFLFVPELKGKSGRTIQQELSHSIIAVNF